MLKMSDSGSRGKTFFSSKMEKWIIFLKFYFRYRKLVKNVETYISTNLYSPVFFFAKTLHVYIYNIRYKVFFLEKSKFWEMRQIFLMRL